MSSPRVTVVMTHYNNPEMALEAVQSVLAQTFPEWELRFYDDGSTRKPELPNDPRIIPWWGPDMAPEVRKSKARYAVLNNLGLQEAQGDLVTYLTHDDLYFPDRLERMVRYMDRNPTLQICFGPQVLRYWENHRWVDRGLRTGPTIVLDPLNLIDHDQVMHRAEVARKTEGWPEDARYWRNADGHFYRRVVKAGGAMRRIDGTQPTDVHRFHDGSVTDLLNKNQLDAALSSDEVAIDVS